MCLIGAAAAAAAHRPLAAHAGVGACKHMAAVLLRLVPVGVNPLETALVDRALVEALPAAVVPAEAPRRVALGRIHRADRCPHT